MVLMIDNLSITLITDNTSNDPRLAPEHGFAAWIEADDRRILFDTGRSDIMFANANALDIDLRTADTLILSHGHYDHTGNIASILELNHSLEIFCHPAISISRYSRHADGAMRSIGMSQVNAEALRQHAGFIHWTSRPIFVSDDIGITGPIPRHMPFEDTGGDFFLDADAKQRDPVDDDCAIWFVTAQGLTVVTGCCHSGIINTLAYIRSITGVLPLRMVIGGLHLLHATNERVDSTCDYLASRNIDELVPCHCTGNDAIERMKFRLGDVVKPGGLRFPDARH